MRPAPVFVDAASPPQNVISLAVRVLDQTLFRFVPTDAVYRCGIANPHFLRMLAVELFFALLQRHALRRVRHDERAVPALIETVLFIVDDVGVEVVETSFPGLVFLEQWVGAVLVYRAQRELGIPYILNNAAIE